MLPLALLSSLFVGFMAFVPTGQTNYSISGTQNQNTTVGKNGSGQNNGKTVKNVPNRPAPTRNT